MAFCPDRRGGNFMNCQSSRKHTHSHLEQVGDTVISSPAACKEVPSSMANPCSSANIADRLLVSDWNPFVPMPEHVDLIGKTASSYSAGTQGNQRVSSSGGCLVGQIQSHLRFSSENISEIGNSYALSGDLQITGALGPTGWPASDEHGIGKNSKGKKRKAQECGVSDSQSKFHRSRNAEAEHKKDGLPESIKSTKEKDVNKPKGEQCTGIKNHKLTLKQAQENSSSADAQKEDYIHVQAKRGQAANSHSLAERLRREKISERMRFLHDLVPGCRKITGKAVMLDEIINYVQSMQRQVEFLAMKLATVSSKLNYDIEHILSKDQPIQQVLTQLAVDSNPNSGEVLRHTLAQISPVTQISYVWDDDLQYVMQMSFIPNAHFDASTEQSGSMKIEQ